MLNELLIIGYLAMVTNVVDGDTVDVMSLSNTSKVARVKLVRITAPTKPDEDLSKEHLRQLILGATVDVKIDKKYKDGYKRTGADIFSEGESVSEQMVVDGFATRNAKYAKEDHVLDLLQRHAMNCNHGLWGDQK